MSEIGKFPHNKCYLRTHTFLHMPSAISVSLVVLLQFLQMKASTINDGVTRTPLLMNPLLHAVYLTEFAFTPFP